MAEDQLAKHLDTIHENLVFIGKMVDVRTQGYAWQYDAAFGYYVPGYMALGYVEKELDCCKSPAAIRKDLASDIVRLHTGLYVPDAVGQAYINKIRMGVNA